MKSKIVYIVDFPIDISSGKSKATREKAEALRRIVGDDKFIFFSAKNNKNIFLKLIDLIVLDLRCSLSLIFMSNIKAVFQRALFLPFTFLVQRIKRINVINEFHTDLKDEIPHLNKSKYEKMILNILADLSDKNIKSGRGIIYNHPILKQKFDPVFKIPSIYSYNGANEVDFYPEDKDVIRKSLNINPEIEVCLFLGAASKWHGVEYLVEIFNQPLIQQRKSLFLYIVGAEDESYTARLKGMFENPNIVIVPPVNTDIARNYINASDFCLLPVNQIRVSPGSPLKLYDYISCGKAIISQSNLLGYSDEVERYNLGYTLDFRDAELSAVKLLNIVDESHDFSCNNIKVAREFVSWEVRMNQWVKFADSLN